ncbi:ROK family transcriptional regulator [Saccharothrix australiensis]|uniref:Putative NBD/HSP70 family sugar kinase n=1 Tax=Saccharothrix australiensis TaxID=2072 RepID=A0A495W0E6_9PSEU|nr:ROK family transcriptional regulator [Saccharothrix australiensis]RKT54864.1 putative NBD/HSP70 family sugar kinase [Saccharothrix australiensis]
MPASPSAARAINDREALLLLRDGPLTAAELTRRTGLSRPTIAELVKRLGDAGLVTVVGEADVRRRGPNAALYGIVRDRAHVAALDIRTHSVAVVVADLVGDVLAEAALPIGPDDAATAVGRTVALLTDTARGVGATTLHSVGIGVPGVVDPVSGELRSTPGLPPWHSGVMAALRDLPSRLVVENETSVAALAEHRAGNARDLDSFALLWLGHGTGAALVLGGVLHRGASGGAGELGFLPVPDVPVGGWVGCSAGVRPGGPAAGSAGSPATGSAGSPAGGSVGSRAAGVAGGPGRGQASRGFHSLASSPAIAALAAAHGLTATPAPHEPPAAALVREAVSAGAEGFLSDLADRVAIGAAAIAAVLDPGCVVLGGEVGRAGGTALAERVAERLAALSPVPTTVRPSTLGGSAVLRGALLTACETTQDDVFGGVPRP